jgi:hypothetical protein
MGRIIGAVVAGFLAFFGIFKVLIVASLFAVGADRAFRPGSWEPSMTWIFFMFLAGFIAALVGGWVATKIADSFQAAKWLAVVVLALGLLMALPTLSATPSKEPRPANLNVMEAMNKARTPKLVALANPVIGVAGVWVGGKRRRSASAAPTS